MPPDCPWCRAPLQSGDVDRERQVVRCRACDALTAVELTPAELAGEGPPPVFGGAAARSVESVPEGVPLTAPESFDVEERGREVTITWRPLEAERSHLGPGVAGLGLILVLLARVIARSAQPLLVTGALLVLLGLPLVWLAKRYGPQVITCDGVRLRVRSRAGGSSRRTELTRDELDQLHAFAYRTGYRRTLTRYGLRAILADGTRQDLVTDITSAPEALWLEHELERRLGIEDRYVEGQLRPPGATATPPHAVTAPKVRPFAAAHPSLSVEVRRPEGGLEVRWRNERAGNGLGLFAALGCTALSIAFGGWLLTVLGPNPGWVLAAGLVGCAGLWVWVEARSQTPWLTVRVDSTRVWTSAAEHVWRARTFQRADIEQLYVYRSWETDDVSERPTFGVKAIVRDGRHLVLARRLATPADARFIEQTLEAHLGIVDRAVHEEYTGA
jgi:hypothetical protein